MRDYIVVGLLLVAVASVKCVDVKPYATQPEYINCVGQSTGLHTVAEGCTNTFYNCDGNNDVAPAQQCPAGLVVNKEKGICDYPQNVEECGGSGTTTTTTVGPIVTDTTTKSTTTAPVVTTPTTTPSTTVDTTTPPPTTTTTTTTVAITTEEIITTVPTTVFTCAFNCSGKAKGRYALSTCSDTYYYCNGLPDACHPYTCASGLVYDETTSTCVSRCTLPECGGYELDNDNWTVIQRRSDRRFSFNRDWDEYVIGFGDPFYGDFWLGLEEIYLLTKDGDQELRIDMITDDGEYVFAYYGSFEVSSVAHNYELRVDGYCGNATDCLGVPNEPLDFGGRSNHQHFSTPDNDNDQYGDNCAEMFDGGWWYKACFSGNLNGIMGEVGFSWIDQSRNWRWRMARSEMKIRKNQSK